MSWSFNRDFAELYFVLQGMTYETSLVYQIYFITNILDMQVIAYKINILSFSDVQSSKKYKFSQPRQLITLTNSCWL